MSLSLERKLIADTPSLPVLAPMPLRKMASLSSLWGLFIQSRGNLSPRSLDMYRFFAKKFLGFFREKDLTGETIMEWVAHVRNTKGRTGAKITPQRINAIQCRVQAFLKFLKKMGFIHSELWELIPWEKVPDPRPRPIITHEEYEHLKARLAPTHRYQYVLWLCILGYRTGMDLECCCHLRWDQVFLNEEGPSYLVVPRMKLIRYGEKAVCQIPIIPGSDVHEWLLKLKEVKNYPRADGLNYVHQDCPGLYWNTSVKIHVDLRKAFILAGLEGRSFGYLRHTFVSNLVNSGMPYALICKITGHTNMKTLLRYVNPDRKALEDGVLKAQIYAATKMEEQRSCLPQTIPPQPTQP